MVSKALFRSAVLASGLAFAAPAMAVNGQILITQKKAINGGVTPGDAPGFPVTLTLPGSYALASNLGVPDGLDGIDAAYSDISIDLNGFTISGGPAGGTNNGSRAIEGRFDRLTVRNGTISAFVLGGIDHGNRAYLIVTEMRIINNRGYGVFTGSMSRIQNSTVALNAGGVRCYESCHVEGNVLSFNAASGVGLRSGTVLGNTIHGNRFGIYVSDVGSRTVGYGNNTLLSNEIHVRGSAVPLMPNFCDPQPC